MRVYLYLDRSSSIFFGNTPADRAVLQEVVGSGIFRFRDLKRIRRAMNRSGYGVSVVNLGQARLLH
jgi:hypothetical protein